MWSICRSASRAPRAPSSASASSRARLERTSAYSPITKNALTRTSSPVRMMNRAFTGGESPAAPALGRPRAPSSVESPSSVSCYFEMGRRRSCSDGKTVAAAPPGAGRPLGESVDALGELEVRLGEPTGRVVGDREPDLVPPVDEDVGMVVHVLGDLGHLVHE